MPPGLHPGRQSESGPNQLGNPDSLRSASALDPSYGSWFSQAVTAHHADLLEQEARQHQAAMANLSSLGWTGTGLRIVASVTDPTALLLGAATGGLGEAAVAGRSVGVLGRVAAQAGAGAAANIGATAALKASGLPEVQSDSLGHAALTGALFGAGFGLLGGGAHTAPETDGIINAARSGLNDMRGSTGRPMEAGAAYNPAAPILGDGAGLSALRDSDVAKTAMAPARFSVAAETGGSSSPSVRALGGALFEDGVGKTDCAVNPHSAELELRTGLNSYGAEYARSYLPAVQAWAKDMSYGPWEYRQRIGEFEAQVADAVRGSDDPMSVEQTPGYVQQLAGVISQQSNRLRELANDPFSREGTEGRAIQGFGTIPRDDTYLTRIWSPQKVGAYVEKNGMVALQQLLMRGIRSARPDLDVDLLDKMSTGFAQNIYRRAVGAVDPTVSRMFAVDDLNGFQRDLTETWGLAPEDAAAIRGQLERDGDAGADTRAKRRVLMDVNGTWSDGTAIKDLLVNDATFLHKAYTRHMLGKIALARVRILNPGYDEAAGRAAQEAAEQAGTTLEPVATGSGPADRFLVNGITGDADWTRALQSIRDSMANERMGPDKIEAATSALQYGYERLLGIPHPQAGSGWALAGRMLNKINIVRLGSSFVFPHSGQIASMISQVGIKHLLANMPAFRRIVSGDGEMLLRQGLPREAEQIWGSGVERMLSRVEGTRWDHDLGVVPYQGRSSWYQKADHYLTTAGHAVMDASGFSAMDGLMRRWTTQAIAGKFADLAKDIAPNADGSGAVDLSKLSDASLRRMRFWGLDDDTLSRVIGQVQQHSDTADGTFFGGTKVNRLNLDQWGDQEAAVKFTNAVQRYSSKIVQDNDIGALHKWMSHPMWRLFLQLRNFPVAAWDKRLLHNIHMRDGNALAYFAADTAVPAAIYGMQHSIAAMGRDDKEDYLAKHLSVEQLAKAGVERSSYASLFPVAGEFASTLAHLGQPHADKPTDVLTNNTTTGTINDGLAALGGLVNPVVQNRTMSQDEARSVGRMVSNNLLFTAVLNRMIQGRPKHAPMTVH